MKLILSLTELDKKGKLPEYCGQTVVKLHKQPKQAIRITINAVKIHQKYKHSKK